MRIEFIRFVCALCDTQFNNINCPYGHCSHGIVISLPLVYYDFSIIFVLLFVSFRFVSCGFYYFFAVNERNIDVCFVL